MRLRPWIERERKKKTIYLVLIVNNCKSKDKMGAKVWVHGRRGEVCRGCTILGPVGVVTQATLT